jgi:hypothetical protein
MDVPSLPPLPLPDGHDANNNAIPFLVQQYVIEDVQDLPQELRSHVTMFYKDLITLMEGVLELWQLITKENYTMMLTAMICIRDGEPVKLLRSIYPQVYKWCKKYALVTSGDIFVIVVRPRNAYGYTSIDKNVDVETVKRLIYFEAAYSDIKRAHGQEHTKGRTLHACLNKHYFDSIGCQPRKLFTNTCQICCDNRPAQH